jgi:hypothetical protein
VVNRDDFRKVMDNCYRTRGWNLKTGLFTRTGPKALDLDDILPATEEKGFKVVREDGT